MLRTMPMKSLVFRLLQIELEERDGQQTASSRHMNMLIWTVRRTPCL